jgi:predicted negative regulator of RcsB-dependent stress response
MSQFYLAICEIEKNNLQNANEYLNDLILKKDHVFLEQAYWYLALTQLKQNNFEDAESILEKVVQENMTRKPDAEVILKNLN